VYLLVFIQNLLMHIAEKILLLQPLKFGGDYLTTSGILSDEMPLLAKSLACLFSICSNPALSLPVSNQLTFHLAIYEYPPHSQALP
jgi:hypothetical protein